MNTHLRSLEPDLSANRTRAYRMSARSLPAIGQTMKRLGANMANSVLQRFQHKYVIDLETGCWMWTASALPKGYGFFYDGEKQTLAHRWSYKNFRGAIPAGKCVLHRCDRPGCVNPAHLFLGTNADNVKDMVAKGRQARGERMNHAYLTAETVIKIRKDRSNGLSVEMIAERHGTSPSNVKSIVNRDSWKHI